MGTEHLGIVMMSIMSLDSQYTVPQIPQFAFLVKNNGLLRAKSARMHVERGVQVLRYYFVDLNSKSCRTIIVFVLYHFDP